MSVPIHDGHLPSETLDRLVLSALTPAEKAGADAHMEGCDRCRTALQTLQADCDHFERDVYPRTLGRVRQRLDDAPRFGLSWDGLRRLWPALGVMAAAAALLLVAPRGLFRGPADEIGIKGGPLLQVFGKHGDRVQVLATGSRVAPGDRLRFVVDPAGYEYLMIVSVDGTGEVQAFYPMGGQASQPIPQGRFEVPDSVELDGAKGPERLVGYFTHRPVQLGELQAALRSDPEHPPRVGEGAAPTMVRLEKAVP